MNSDEEVDNVAGENIEVFDSLDELEQSGPSSESSSVCSNQEQDFQAELRRKMEREDSVTALLQTVDAYIKNKKPKTFAASVASTFVALCDEWDAKQPGESTKLCDEVLKLIQKATSKLSE